MTQVQQLESGDPRRIIELSPAERQTELLWGCTDPKESSRMSEIIVNGGWLALTLSEKGAGSFAFLKNALPGVRQAYFIDYFALGTISSGPMLLGQFLFEFENASKMALKLFPGLTNRIYFRHGDNRDNRIDDYNLLSAEEIVDTRNRLQTLLNQQPGYRETITRLITTLDK